MSDPESATATDTTLPTSASLADIIGSSIDAALSRWDAAFGLSPEALSDGEVEAETPSPETAAIEEVRCRLTVAVRLAVSNYLAEHGVAHTEADEPELDPTLLVEHGLPIALAVMGAIEEAIGSTAHALQSHPQPLALRDSNKGRIALDFLALFAPEEDR